MNEKELLSALKQQLQHCAGFEGDEIAKAREEALNYYFQRPRGDEVPGRSRVVSGDLSAMTEAVTAQMLDAFTSDNIVEFDATGAEDEDQAQLESDVVSHFVMKENNGFYELGKAIKEALLMRTGYIRVSVEDRQRTETQTYLNATPEALVELTNRPGVECKVVKYEPETGFLKLRCTYHDREFKVAALPSERFLYTKGWHTHDLQDIPFCAEWDITSRSELIAMGFPKVKVERTRKTTIQTKSIVHASRNPGSYDPHKVPIDESQDPILWYRAYVLIDKDGDGIAERREICFTDDEILSDEPVNLVPYAAGSAIINPHRLEGVSLFDKLKQIQDEHTGLKRMRLDGLNTAIKNRLAYLDGAANADDVANGVPNGAIRIQRKAGINDVRQAIMPFQVPDTSASVQQNIEALKAERTELGGAALELATGQLQIGGDRMGSQGLDRAYSVVEQLSALMTKNIAATLIRGVFLLAHATLREWYSEPVSIKRQGKWETAVPAEWPVRRRVTVKVGMSPGERARKAAALRTILQDQIALAEAGMDEVLVNLDGFYRVLMDWARVSEIPNPEQYFRDPQSPEAQQAIQTKQQQAQQQDAMRQQLMTQALAIERFGLMLEKYRADQTTQFNYWKEVLGAEIEEAKIVGKATADLLKAKETPNERPEGPSEGAEGKQSPAGDSGAAAD